MERCRDGTTQRDLRKIAEKVTDSFEYHDDFDAEAVVTPGGQVWVRFDYHLASGPMDIGWARLGCDRKWDVDELLAQSDYLSDWLFEVTGFDIRE